MHEAQKITAENYPVTRKWIRKIAGYRYSCGCQQDQDGWVHCSFHKAHGPDMVMKNLVRE